MEFGFGNGEYGLVLGHDQPVSPHPKELEETHEGVAHEGDATALGGGVDKEKGRPAKFFRQNLQ